MSDKGTIGSVRSVGGNVHESDPHSPLHLKYNALIYYFHTFYLIWWIKDLHDIPIFPFCLLALYP